MTTLRLIEYIEEHPEYPSIVFIDTDTTRDQEDAIEFLKITLNDPDIINKWRINGSLEKDTLLVYHQH